MDARNAVQRIVAIVKMAYAILVIVAGASFPVFASPVYIYSGNFDLPIPADPDNTRGWMTDAIIEVPDHFTIHDLDVGINLTHTNVFDLQIFLQSPTATQLCLNMYNFDQFFEGANYTNTIFDDEAEVAIEQAVAPFTGRFRPLEPHKLSEFDDEDTYGFWHLQIYDAFYADTGTLDSFELIFSIPEPATAILLILGTALMSLQKRRSNLKKI